MQQDNSKRNFSAVTVSSETYGVLSQLAKAQRVSRAALVQRLIWQEARKCNRKETRPCSVESASESDCA